MIAQDINEHLPEMVRALAVQRVNKGFNARERCGTRTYHYFLPAATLDLKGDGESTLQLVCEPYHHFLPAAALDLRGDGVLCCVLFAEGACFHAPAKPDAVLNPLGNPPTCCINRVL